TGGAAALVVSLVSSKNGKVLPVAEACAIARDAGATSIVDAAQALGQVRVDARELGADAVVVLGHKWVHGPLATGACWIRDIERFQPVRLGWRSRVHHDLAGNVELQPDATRFETGTVDAAAFVGLRQSLAVQRMLARVVRERLRALRARVFERLSSVAFDVVSRPADPTGIVAVVPRGGDAAGIVSRMWTQERIVVKHLSEPDAPDGIRISFWALHRDSDIDRLAEALVRHAAVAA
ncbi:MAG: aminotransferase class V-fold PLP-dependent enzyme, partial [Chloroflexota bacterium]|nr:aminotransferase class V-fold PLP-dependent enzyme [Chloroflexota bacterium]